VLCVEYGGFEVKALLKIRGFVKGRDEEILVKIYNATSRTYDDARSVTLEEVKSGKRLRASALMGFS
jgi:hypothetical protein